MVYIVGLGPGSKEYILPKALDTLSKSNIVIGFSRALDSLDFIDSKLEVKSLKEILEFIEEKGEEKEVSIVASGDPTFYGIGEYIKTNYKGKIEIIPGISSIQYLTCKLGKSWGNAYVGSLHGREEDFIGKVKGNKLSIWLTDNKNNPSALCRKLKENNIYCNVISGENLSYRNERILEGTPEELEKEEYSELSIVVVERRA
ncbi:precorrin-6y C5,15-methyltransferase (decarboxylating) subunit CbiE [Clostridium sp. LP20]|uniref:precorrin-6y C5,15-methyltransferase (decarboxylating) subunit CbiE n=1 Tax=Clostridium sp. LP20 TaxID=3418665 RepID=UPI003EE44CC6